MSNDNKVKNENMNFEKPKDADLATKCDELIEAVSRAEKSGTGPGETMLAQMRSALNRAAAQRLVYSYANQHGEVPTGWLGITITTGPTGSGAECTFSWIKTVEQKSFSFKFPEAIVSIETQISENGWDPKLHKNTAVQNAANIDNHEYYLGEYDSNEMMGRSYRTAYWLKRTGQNQWEILKLLPTENSFEKDYDMDDSDFDDEAYSSEESDPELVSEGIFSEAEAIEYLNDAGVDFDQKIFEK